MLFDFIDNKRTNGQYFTEYNPFNNKAFEDWSNQCNIKDNIILEPFDLANESNNCIFLTNEFFSV